MLHLAEHLEVQSKEDVADLAAADPLDGKADCPAGGAEVAEPPEAGEQGGAREGADREPVEILCPVSDREAFGDIARKCANVFILRTDLEGIDLHVTARYALDNVLVWKGQPPDKITIYPDGTAPVDPTIEEDASQYA